MNKLTTALFAMFLCVSFTYAADKPPSEQKKRERPETARDRMIKKRTPEQQKRADCSVDAGSQELKGKERQTFIDKCMRK